MHIYDTILMLVRYLFGGVLLILATLYGLYPFIRLFKKAALPNSAELKQASKTGKAPKPMMDSNTSIKDHPAKKNKSIEILEFARKDPKQTARLLRGWLAEKTQK